MKKTILFIVIWFFASFNGFSQIDSINNHQYGITLKGYSTFFLNKIGAELHYNDKISLEYVYNQHYIFLGNSKLFMAYSGPIYNYWTFRKLTFWIEPYYHWYYQDYSGEWHSSKSKFNGIGLATGIKYYFHSFFIELGYGMAYGKEIYLESKKWSPEPYENGEYVITDYLSGYWGRIPRLIFSLGYTWKF